MMIEISYSGYRFPPEIMLSSRDYPAGDLALCPVHAEATGTWQ
jgi:hypothetical protein